MIDISTFKKYKIGMRTLKTGLAVCISLYLSSFLHLKSPIFAGIAAIIAMQSSVSESFVIGKHRVVGTIIGAFIGLLFSYLLPHNYIFLSIGVILVIHIHNILDWKKSLSLSSIVFLAIALNRDNNRISYAMYRLIDTFLGIVVAMLVNYFIAMPNIEKDFLKTVEDFYVKSKNRVYLLITGHHEFNLDELRQEINLSIEQYNFLKQDIDMNFSKENIKKDYLEILNTLDNIYSNLHILLNIDIDPVINKNNIDMIESIFFATAIYRNDRKKTNLDMVYNYHLSHILSDLLRIETILDDRKNRR